MRNDFLLFVLILISSVTNAQQHVFKVKADTASITNAELILENKTKDTLGFLYNKGNGRTEFRRALVKVNNNTFIIGNDTLTFVGNGSSSNLQSVTNGGKKTTNSIWSKSLIVGDTANRIYADSAGSFAGGNIRFDGTLSADSSSSFAYGAVDSGAIRASNRGAVSFGYVKGAGSSITNTGLGSLTFGRAIVGTSTTSGTYGTLNNSGVSSLVFGNANTGIITAGSNAYGAFAAGSTSYSSTGINPVAKIEANGVGSFAYGASLNGLISSTGWGTFAQGAGYGTILSNGTASFAQGYTYSNGSLVSSSFGSFAQGYVNNGSSIKSSQTGSFAQGYSGYGSTITSSGYGSFAHGYSRTGSTVTASGNGATIIGFGQNKGEMTASGHGSVIMGFVTDSLADGTRSYMRATYFGSTIIGYAGMANQGQIGFINNNGRASIATGWAHLNGTITAASDAANAGGNASGTNSLIYSSGLGSWAYGNVVNGDSIYNTGAGSFLIGGKLFNSGSYSHLFGYGLRNTTNNVFKVGYNKDYLVADGTSGTVTIGVPTSTNSDIEITDATKGVIFKAPTGSECV